MNPRTASLFRCLLPVALLLAGAAPLRAQEPPQRPADLVLIHGKILTVDARDSVAEAVAIRDGKILGVGTTEAMLKLAGKETEVMDLHGRTATPGLIDTHCHFQEVSALYEIELSGVTSIAEVQRLVRERAATLKPGEWVRGAGWDEGKLAEQRLILAADLDQAAPNNPLWLVHTTGHYGVANSLALRLAKITAQTPNPPSGTIDRDAAGNPDGVLKEAAMDLLTPLIPPFSHEQLRNGLLKIMADFNREGMTAVKDPGIQPEAWDLYRELLAENKLTVRVFALWLGGKTVDSARQLIARLGELPRPPQSLGDGMLLSGGVKIFLDGSGGARTAWLYQDWNKNGSGKDAGNTGYPAMDPAIYREQVRLFHNAGIHVSTHAIGDRAIDLVVDTYAQVLKDKPTAGLRHGIIHANIPSDHAIATMAALQKQYDAGYPEAQAEFMWWIGNIYAANFGPERAQRLMPFKTYMEKGVRWAGGSDYFVTPYPARYGLWASVVRQPLAQTYGAHPFGTAESVDIHTALRSYTLWAAHQLFLDERIGSLEPGKDADIAVWDRDLYTIPADDLRNLKCERTFVRGREVYRTENSPVSVR